MYEYITNDTYADMFISFIEYKDTYVAYFRSNLQIRIRQFKKKAETKKVVKKKTHLLYLHYIKEFYDSYFYVTMLSYDEYQARQWLNDIRKGCILACQEVLSKNHIIK